LPNFVIAPLYNTERSGETVYVYEGGGTPGSPTGPLLHDVTDPPGAGRAGHLWRDSSVASR
jgi:hypothetical protein